MLPLLYRRGWQQFISKNVGMYMQDVLSDVPKYRLCGPGEEVFYAKVCSLGTTEHYVRI